MTHNPQPTALFTRHPANPIVLPGAPDWRRVSVFNPAVIFHDGAFWMFERSCASLDPLVCHVGLLRSDDGVSFALASERPVLSPDDFGAPFGTVEDPRVVPLDDPQGRFAMTFVYRPWSAHCFPNGVGVPRYREAENVPSGAVNQYQSGIAVSDDLLSWRVLGLITPPDVHDRDCVLFPSRVGGRHAMLRRPVDYVGPQYGCTAPSIWLAYSDDLIHWDDPILLAVPEQPWEAQKIGAGPSPVLLDEGWLLVYHGVDASSRYRVGLMLLDRDDPTRVLARTRDFVMEPETYYEKVGLIIPHTIFPTAALVRDDRLLLYYGCCDTCISLASAPLADVRTALTA